MIWQDIRTVTEARWSTGGEYPDYEYDGVCFNTLWATGLSFKEIDALEVGFGFPFPHVYREMLSVMNGFEQEKPQNHDADFYKGCYKYPDDITRMKWFFERIDKTKSLINTALREEGFDPDEVVGFVPLYSHRALAVFHDKNLSPVVSVMPHDVIVYGSDLKRYWINEFHIHEYFQELDD